MGDEKNMKSKISPKISPIAKIGGDYCLLVNKPAKIATNTKIVANLSAISKRKVQTTEFAVWCPKCGSFEIIERKKAGNWKLGVCNRCNVRTWLKIVAKVKRFGNKKQYTKLIYIQSPFEAFWSNLDDLGKIRPNHAQKLAYEPLSQKSLN
jgi:hypothetical protein